MRMEDGTQFLIIDTVDSSLLEIKILIAKSPNNSTMMKKEIQMLQTQTDKVTLIYQRNSNSIQLFKMHPE